MREREYEKGEGQREKQTPTEQDLISGLQDHDLSQRQSPNQLSTVPSL